MKTKMTTEEPDWKKIAGERLQKLRVLERQSEVLREAMAGELKRELMIQLHIACFPRDEYEKKLDGIAAVVAERIRPKL
jgi:hypothetical protein